jgi:hypothetical protein
MSVVPHIPIYMKAPNKFIRYEVRDFDDGYGNGGKVRVAIFSDKNGKVQEMDAQVMWEYRNGKKL